jgi:hypothetical protein
VTFITSAWFCVCAGLELATSSESKRKGAWRVRRSLHAVRTVRDFPPPVRAGLLHAGRADHVGDVSHKLARPPLPRPSALTVLPCAGL